MPFSAGTVKPPLHDQITEMQRKIQLLGEFVSKESARWLQVALEDVCFATVS